MSADKLPEFEKYQDWYSHIVFAKKVEAKAEFAARNLGRLALSLGLDAERMAAMQWKPIETAPTGPCIDLWCLNPDGSGERVTDCFKRLELLKDSDEPDTIWLHRGLRLLSHYRPTHWMTLPTPPEPTNEQQQTKRGE